MKIIISTITNEQINKAIAKVRQVTNTTILLIGLSTLLANGTVEAKEIKTDFETMPKNVQTKILNSEQTVTIVTAKAINKKEVVNITDKNDVISDNKANFKKGKKYKITFIGDYVVKIKMDKGGVNKCYY